LSLAWQWTPLSHQVHVEIHSISKHSLRYVCVEHGINSFGIL
jgi:hypothetical protein